MENSGGQLSRVGRKRVGCGHEGTDARLRAEAREAANEAPHGVVRGGVVRGNSQRDGGRARGGVGLRDDGESDAGSLRAERDGAREVG